MSVWTVVIALLFSFPSHAEPTLLTFQQIRDLPRPDRATYLDNLSKTMKRIPELARYLRRAKDLVQQNSQSDGVFFELSENEGAWYRFALQLQLACNNKRSCQDLRELSAHSQFKGWSSK